MQTNHGGLPPHKTAPVERDIEVSETLFAGLVAHARHGNKRQYSAHLDVLRSRLEALESLLWSY